MEADEIKRKLKEFYEKNILPLEIEFLEVEKKLPNFRFSPSDYCVFLSTDSKKYVEVVAYLDYDVKQGRVLGMNRELLSMVVVYLKEVGLEHLVAEFKRIL